jgi:hypothetical protein
MTEKTGNGSSPPARAGLSDAAAELAALTAGFAGPVLWPRLAAAELADELEALRDWAEALVERFGLDSHVVPACWWRHNHLVEALAALRDHERGSYAPTAPPTAAVEFHRALRDIEVRLRDWVAELRCEAGHDASHDRARRLGAEGWEDWLAAEAQRRHAQARRLLERAARPRAGATAKVATPAPGDERPTTGLPEQEVAP